MPKHRHDRSKFPLVAADLLGPIWPRAFLTLVVCIVVPALQLAPSVAELLVPHAFEIHFLKNHFLELKSAVLVIVVRRFHKAKPVNIAHIGFALRSQHVKSANRLLEL